MYSTFSIQPDASSKLQGRRQLASAPADRLRSRRRPVPVACENCRKNRIKCDSLKPCRNCASRDVECVHGDSVDVRSLLKQVRLLVGKVEGLENELQSARASSDVAVGAMHSARAEPVDIDVNAHSTQRSPRPLSSASQTPDVTCAPSESQLDLSSACFFVQLSGALENEGIRHTLTIQSPACPALSADAPAGDVRSFRLPRRVEDYYLRHYWRYIHRNLPVIDEEKFKAQYVALWDSSSVPSARLYSNIVNIVLALSMQHEISSKPHACEQHVPGMPTSKSVREGQRLTSKLLYQSCYSDLSNEHELPSWNTLQCYILMTVYLRNEWRHNSAYQMLGLAIRVANVLGLHKTPPEGALQDEISLRDQMRDFLFCFDVQQFLDFARPCGLIEQSPTRHMTCPSEKRCFWSYWSALLACTKSIYCLLDANSRRVPQTEGHHSHRGGQVSIKLLETEVPQLLSMLQSWAQEVPEKYRIQRHSLTSAPFSIDTHIKIDSESSSWQIRQCLLLELSYHWAIMCLLRWFISTGPSTANENGQKIHPYTTKALQHATAIVGISKQALEDVDTIHGWYDAHAMQWDVVLALIQFIISHPLLPDAIEAIGLLKTCSVMFSDIGTTFTHQAARSIENISVLLTDWIELRIKSTESAKLSDASSLDTPMQSAAVTTSYGEAEALYDLAEFDIPSELDAFFLQDSALLDHDISRN